MLQACFIRSYLHNDSSLDRHGYNIASKKYRADTLEVLHLHFHRRSAILCLCLLYKASHQILYQEEKDQEKLNQSKVQVNKLHKEKAAVSGSI